jgi:hypothetical protein
MSVILSNASIVPSMLAVGETGALTLTVKNTNTWTAAWLTVSVYAKATVGGVEETKYIGIPADAQSISIAQNASRAFALSVNMLDVPAILNWFQEIEMRSAGLMVICQLSDKNKVNEDYGFYYTPADALVDMRYAPSIPIFAVERSPAADSTGAAVDIACTLATGADPTYAGLALTLQWKEEDATTFPTENTLAVTVADALAAGGTTVTPSFTFETGKAYTLRATFTDGIDSAVSETKLSKAFKVINVHPTSKNIGEGQFAVADTSAGLVHDSMYKYRFHEGVGNLTHAHILEMLGVQTGETSISGGVPNGWKDVAVTFPIPYKQPPLILIFPQTGNIAAANVGSNLLVLLENTLTATGFTARWYNNTSDTRYPKVRWIAIGELDT